MAAVGDNNFIRYIYRGEEGEIVLREATHITVAEDCTFVRARAFYEHPNIVEVICHDKVKKIGERAFYECTSLKRVIMPGVEVVERGAFMECEALEDVEFDKLEIIKDSAFRYCDSLKSINLQSARIVESNVFIRCDALVDAEFGNKLERIDERAFGVCRSLERITIPLKDGLFNEEDTFWECEELKHVDLVEGEVHETIASLQFEEWRKDMKREIDSINRILPTECAGKWYDDDWNGDYDYVGKAREIRRWIRSVIVKIIGYKAEHQRVMDGAATTLQHVLPQDIVMKNVFSFLELPPHTFELGEYQEVVDLVS